MLSLFLVAAFFAVADGYTTLPSGAIEGELLNPAPPAKNDLLGKAGKSDIKKLGDKDRNALGAQARWPNGIVPYVIDSSFNPSMVQYVNQAIQDFNDYTCVKFVKRTTEANYIKFIDDHDGCYSYVGNIKRGAQNLALQYPGCDSKGTAIHELMHAIGFEHEQCRPDRDSYINILTSNVEPSMLNNFDKNDGVTAEKGNTFGFAYDFNSIMHYSNDSFGKNGALTMTRKDGKPLLVQHMGFSDYDVKKINLYYECAGKPGFTPKTYVRATAPPPAVIDPKVFAAMGIDAPPTAWGCTTIDTNSCKSVKTTCASSGGYSWGWKASSNPTTGATVCTAT
jgi:hypothetical protein